MDLAQFAGEDYADVTLDGATYRVFELKLSEWAPVQAWIKATVPGPLSCLASPDFRRLPPEVKREVLGEAMDRDRTSWPPRIGTRNWFLALDHPGGHAVALLAILGRGGPGLTLEECSAIVEGESVTFADILPAFAAALGMFGPKSPAPAPPGTTTTPTATGATATRPTTSGTSRSSSSRRRAGRGKTSST